MLRSLLSAALLLNALLLTACNSNTITTKAVTDTVPVKPPAVGGDADQHGCKASAGYTWSVIQNKCIRLFESGTRLDAQDNSLNKSLSAFVVFKSAADSSQAELFIPGKPGSLLLNKSVAKGTTNIWILGSLQLSQWKGSYILKEQNKILYKSPPVKQ